jgi:hypothetical protein
MTGLVRKGGEYRTTSKDNYSIEKGERFYSEGKSTTFGYFF